MKTKLVLLTVLSIFIMSGSLFAQSSSPEPQIFTSIKHDVSIPLCNIPPHPPGVIEREEKEMEQDREQTIYDRKNLIEEPDPARQINMGTRATRDPYFNFEGVQDLDNPFRLAPPDTDGDIGPNHYFQMCNVMFEIFDRVGTSLYGPANISTIWDGFIGPWTGETFFDPIILYDQVADRWFASSIIGTNPGGSYWLLIAVTQTGDPTGTWNQYAFAFSAIPEYPKYGVWPDGYYMGCNKTSGWDVAVFDRDAMLTGAPALMIGFDNPDRPVITFHTVLPSDCDGPFPPLGTPNYFMTINDNTWGGSDELRMWEFHVDWATPANSTWTYLTPLSITPFSSQFAGGSSSIPQPGTTQKLDPKTEVLMFRAQFRNFGLQHRIVCNHTVDVGIDHAGIRWYELRNSGSGWSVYQQSSYAPDADHRWMGSIAMNGRGDIALGYSVSSSTTYPSIRYTGRRNGDLLNTMTYTEGSIWAGGFSQTGTNRWGDYSAMAVDPVDDATFWYTNEYVDDYGGYAPWSTRIASFDLECWATVNSEVEYISNVTVGSINNTTGWSPNGYGDYSHLSTTMHKGSPYPITITIGNYFPEDEGAVWVDWNNDGDFDDFNETITPITGSPGPGPYTATIIPPLGTSNGPKTMRVRINWDDAPPPCGNTTWGEVEDYTIQVADPTVNIWEGDHSYVWYDPENWSLGHVPIATENVQIPNTYTYYPLVHHDSYVYDAFCNDLTVDNGATLWINNGTLEASGEVNISGNLTVNHPDAELTVFGTIFWKPGSSANTNTFCNFWIFGYWYFEDGANVNLTNGRVNFVGSNLQYIRILDNNCFFNQIHVSKPANRLGYSAVSTQPLRLHGDLQINLPGEFYSNNTRDIIIEGDLINYDACDLTVGTVVFHGGGQWINFASPGSFNNLTIHPSSYVAMLTDIDILGDMMISRGQLFTLDFQINIAGNWTNTVGAEGFVEDNGRVVFNRPSGHSYILSDETFNILEADIDAAIRIDDVSHTVTCNEYDWSSGGINVLAGTFTALDLTDNGIFGGYWLYPDGEINLYQNSGTWIDLNGELHIFGGEMNVFGGTDVSAWPYLTTGSLEMSDGILDIKDHGVYVNNTGPFTENITGGLIRANGRFIGDRTDFTPEGGTIALYGSADHDISHGVGSNFYNIIIDKSTKGNNPENHLNGSRFNLEMLSIRSNTIIATTDLFIEGDLTIDNGLFDANEKIINVGGNWTNNVGDAGFDETNSTVIFYGPDSSVIKTGETFYNLSEDKTFTNWNGLETENGNTVNVLNDLNLIDGTFDLDTNTTLNIFGNLEIAFHAGLNANVDPGLNISIGGNWTNHNTSHNTNYGFYSGTSTVTFLGPSDSYLTTDAPAEEFYDLVLNMSGADFYTNDKVMVHNDFDLYDFWIDLAPGFYHYFLGDFTVHAGGAWNPGAAQTVVFTGSTYQEVNYPDTYPGYFQNVIVDKAPVFMDKPSGPEAEPGNNISDEDEERVIPKVVMLSALQCLDGGNLIIDEGILDMNGEILRTTGEITINSGGNLLLNDNSICYVDDGHTLTVNDGGTIHVLGTLGNEPKITRLSTGYYDLIVNAGGLIGARHAIFEFMGFNGVFIDDGGIIDHTFPFDYCTFKNGKQVDEAALLVINNDQLVEIFQATFVSPVKRAPITYNVAKDDNQGHVIMYNAGGDFAGPTHEYDFYDLVDWSDPYLQITPDFQDVPDTANSTSFNVDNTGTGLMNWTAHVPLMYSSWLSITGGSAGTNAGTIDLDYEINTGAARTGKVVVAGNGALNSPDTVEVRQEQAQYYIVVPSNTLVSGDDTCIYGIRTITIPDIGGSYIVSDGSFLTLKAGDSIKILNDFHAEEGSFFHAYISDVPCTVLRQPSIVDAVDVGIETTQNENLVFNVYPNPTSGDITLELITGSCEQNLYIEIYDILGEPIYNEMIFIENRLKLNMSGIPPGIYFVKVICGDEIFVEKILKY